MARVWLLLMHAHYRGLDEARTRSRARDNGYSSNVRRRRPVGLGLALALLLSCVSMADLVSRYWRFSFGQKDSAEQDMATRSYVPALVRLQMPGHATTAASPPCETLVETTLADLDLGQVARELLADEWAERDNLLVKVLHENGARGMSIEPWVGHSRNMTFRLPLGIPWSKVLAYLRLDTDSDSSEAAAHDNHGGGLTEVLGTHQVTVGSDDALHVTSRYLCQVPVVKVIELRMEMTLSPHRDDGNVALRFGSFVDSGLSDGFVTRLMEKGFLRAARSYGLALRAELERRRLHREARLATR